MNSDYGIRELAGDKNVPVYTPHRAVVFTVCENGSILLQMEYHSGIRAYAHDEYGFYESWYRLQCDLHQSVDAVHLNALPEEGRWLPEGISDEDILADRWKVRVRK